MIVGVLTDPMVGGTFLSWTLHFLAGHDTYYNAMSKSWTRLTSSPLTQYNAHGFDANQPNTYNEALGILGDLVATPTDKFHTIYYHNLAYLHTSKSQMQEVVDKTFKESTKRIILVNPQSNALYFCKYGARILSQKLGNPYQRYSNYQEQHDDFIDTFFDESKRAWGQAIKEKWEEREFLALNIRPLSKTTIEPYIKVEESHFWLNTNDLWASFDSTVSDLFKYLEIAIDESRWDQWVSVYHQWRKLHYDRIQFANYFDRILHNIIYNGNMDLTRFNLDIIREATIQHALIYKHGLTLKSWGLEKFPNNTKDLHILLEPNVYHDVEDIYNIQKGNK